MKKWEPIDARITHALGVRRQIITLLEEIPNNPDGTDEDHGTLPVRLAAVFREVSRMAHSASAALEPKDEEAG